ncbi:hypothetical protein NDU88_005044 [Pleurodeles waltl]|uniref:Uncharacterized protein n=1 Tax=Pleurodeles waltl TaxID=8319 RepID=A0AAV7TA50_PLEWA|nr:hypothetical protein NDU88_005044 [Pleurodeles waltl]
MSPSDPSQEQTVKGYLHAVAVVVNLGTTGSDLSSLDDGVGSQAQDSDTPLDFTLHPSSELELLKSTPCKDDDLS